MKSDDVKYVLDRLDADHVRGCADQARALWDAGEPSWEVAYMPGDGTHYGLLFTVLRPETRVLGAPGGGSNMDPYTITGCKFDGGHALVYWIQRDRGAFLGRLDFAHPGWVESQYPDGGPASSLAIAVLLNEITGVMPGWQERFIANVREAEDYYEAAEAEGATA